MEYRVLRGTASQVPVANPLLKDVLFGRTDVPAWYICDGRSWSMVSAGGGYTIVTVTTTPYTVANTIGITMYQVDCTSGNIVINFPTAIGSDAVWGIKKIDSSANTITLTPFAGQTIDGEATQTIRFQNTQVDIFSNNANLFIK